MNRYTSCDLTYRFPIRVHFIHVPVKLQVFLFVGFLFFVLSCFGVYILVHWRNRCQNRMAERARRRAENLETSDMSEEWEEVYFDESDPNLSNKMK